ncbi:MAG TPA: glutathionylspermidine synthase family protein [Polyangiaceae bacterium]|nr:glutathionylspermidine synthase family protein [Polyangiaceae bacterium]
MLDGLTCGAPLSVAQFSELKERAVREAFKWNVSDGGVDTLLDFPLLLTRALWRMLSERAVLLAREAEAAEQELLERPVLRSLLGVPLALQRALGRTRSAPGLRYSRFDFHPTQSGEFVITEGNLDAAGGWNEAGGVTSLFAEHYPDAEPVGDPAGALAAALARRIGPHGVVGIMHLTHYVDDHQVARALAHAFRKAGLDSVHFDPSQLRNAGARAAALIGDDVRPLDAIFRFFPADWSCRLVASGRWFESAARPGTLWSNPLATILTQSKRFPLVWGRLATPLPTWSRLLPETRDPLLVRRNGWVLKPAFGHEGFDVAVPEAMERRRLDRLWRRARLAPWAWAAQRNFGPLALATPSGFRYPCIGVYVVDGQPAGAYARLAERPLIDENALGAAVLVQS